MTLITTKEKLLGLTGEFTWFWGDTFFIETEIGNFVWSSPDYETGTNTMKKFDGTIKLFIKSLNSIPYGRSKGTHFISDYCGTEFTLI
jgi:hypothetical protein